jgi:hypothetical protein
MRSPTSRHGKARAARYIGTRRDLFDLRRAAATQNLETAQRLMQPGSVTHWIQTTFNMFVALAL